MRIEIIIFLITAALIANLYTDGKYLKILLGWKKYYQMAGIALAGYVVYWLLKKNPNNAKQIVMASNEYIKYLPVDKNTSSFISPILDFTSKQNFGNDSYLLSGGGGNPDSILGLNSMQNKMSYDEKRLMTSGGKSTKRSVSETKKKYVASSQNWKCGECKQQLKAWFEVDHKIRLENGGSNHIDNLVALCRDCHGQKTTIENL
jgi:hypothetical protein